MSEERSVSDPRTRRKFMSTFSQVAMAGGLVAAYGTLTAFMARFLYPARGEQRGWMFVSDVGRVKAGEALNFSTPSGSKVVIARQGRGNTAQDFVALSSTCPHLGCQVHWEPHNSRFFCPCHNGVFTPQGKAIEGPPAKAKQELPRYPLMVKEDLLYIEVPTEELAMGEGVIEESPATRISGPGHDPCLQPPSSREA